MAVRAGWEIDPEKTLGSHRGRMARQRKLSNPLLRTGLRCYYSNGDPPDMTDVCRGFFSWNRCNDTCVRCTVTVKFLGETREFECFYIVPLTVSMNSCELANFPRDVTCIYIILVIDIYKSLPILQQRIFNFLLKLKLQTHIWCDMI